MKKTLFAVALGLLVGPWAMPALACGGEGCEKAKDGSCCEKKVAEAKEQSAPACCQKKLADAAETTGLYRMQLDGMQCAVGCPVKVTEAIKKVEGVQKVEVVFDQKLVKVQMAEGKKLCQKTVMANLKAAGYTLTHWNGKKLAAPVEEASQSAAPSCGAEKAPGCEKQEAGGCEKEQAPKADKPNS